MWIGHVEPGEWAADAVKCIRLVSVSPAIWVAKEGLSGHTGIRRRSLTGGMFGVTNPTCDDSSKLPCDRNAAVGKMSFRDKVSVEHSGL